MQTLGLDGTPPPQPWYRLWVWPEVSDPVGGLSAVRLAKRACFAFAVTCLVIGIMTGDAIGSLVVAIFVAFAAIGLGQFSFPASVMMLVFFSLTTIVDIRAGQMPGILGLAFFVLLLNAVRATWLVTRLDPATRAAYANPELDDTWEHRLLDRLAPAKQQRLKILLTMLLLLYFAVLATGAIGLIILGGRGLA